jgi:hypothetical protein
MKPVKPIVPLALYFVMLFTGCGGGAEFKGDSPQKSAEAPPTPPPVVQPTDKEIRFGVDRVFRIGDDNYPNSSCKEQVASYQLSGTRYFFEFEVTEPQTLIDISINRVCGVDYMLTNTTRLMKNNMIYQVLPLVKGSDKIQYQALTLDPGKYAVIVESMVNYTQVRKGDFDDFVVGDIAVKANKKIAGGNVRTE